MLIENCHRLLKRQIKKSGLSDQCLEKMSVFLNQVNMAYLGNDKDINRLENILETSSQELYKVNQILKGEVESKSLEIIETQQRLEKIVNQVENVIFETDKLGNFVFLNFAWETMSGYKVSESLNRSFWECLVDKSEFEKFKIATDQTLMGQQKARFQIKTKDNKVKWVDFGFTPIYDKEGKLSKTMGSIVDVTEQKNTEQTLLNAKLLEEKANQAKSTFLSTMSHEIRTPLNSLIGISNILLMEDHLQEQVENLHGLKYSSEHLLSLINDILDFNKIQSGNLELERKDFSLNYLINGLSKSFTPNAEKKGLRIKFRKDTELPDVITGDKTRLVQVLSNLINNAIKFTHEGQIEIYIDKIKGEGENVQIEFSVKDSGIGIPPSKQDSIFNPFQQASSSTTREYGGTGLGLSISKNLVQLMGGELNLVSKEGMGSTFSFEIPFNVSKSFDVKQNNVDLISSFSGLEGLNILIAEDYKMNVHVLTRFLKKWNIKYQVTSNGGEAVEKFRTDQFDVILMDLQMPVLDGYAATQQIREIEANKKCKSTPIIALTASAEIQVQEKAISSGFDAFVTKPFNPVYLYNTLKNVTSSQN